MTRLSVIDNFLILWKLMIQAKYSLIAIILLLAIGIGLGFINNKNKKYYKSIYIILMMTIVGYIVVSYYPYLGKMIQYMMDNFFIAVFFPNTAIYLFAIITMNIIVWITVLNNKSSKQIKSLNIVIYIIMNYLFILLINIIKNEKLDIFTQSAIYENNNAKALIEISSILFMIWIIFLILYKLILKYLKKDSTVLSKLPENYQPLSIPSTVYRDYKETETYPEYTYLRTIMERKGYEPTRIPEMVYRENKKEEPEIIDVIKEKDYHFIDTPDIVQRVLNNKKSSTVKIEEKDYLPTSSPEIVQRVLKNKKPTTVEVDEKDYELTSSPESVQRVINHPKQTTVIVNEKDYKPTSLPELIYSKFKSKVNNKESVEKKDYKPIPVPNTIARKVTNKPKTVKEISQAMTKQEDMFSKEDYLLFSQILKNQQRKMQEKKRRIAEQNNSYRAMNNSKTAELFGTLSDIELDNPISTKSESTYRDQQKREIIQMEEERRQLLQKEVERQKIQTEKENQEQVLIEKAREEAKMTELERLYQSINY